MMMQPLRKLSCFCATAFVTLALTACDPGTVIVPEDPDTLEAYEELSQAWWQWSFSIAGDHPLDDVDGSLCQLGDVADGMFFLAGSNGGSATRNCEIPADTALFLPIINGVALNNPADPPQTAEELAAGLDGLFQLACNLELTLDGQAMLPSLAGNRVPTGPFSVDVADGHFSNDPPNNLPAGHYDPVMSDGYWALITPLPPGEHLLEFGGSLCIDGQPIFTTGVTYNLSVAEVSTN